MNNHINKNNNLERTKLFPVFSFENALPTYSRPPLTTSNFSRGSTHLVMLYFHLCCGLPSPGLSAAPEARGPVSGHRRCSAHGHPQEEEGPVTAGLHTRQGAQEASGHSGGGSPFLGCTFLGAARGSQAWLQGSQMKKLRPRKGAKGTPGQAPLPSMRCRVSTACVLPALNLCSRLGLPI